METTTFTTFLLQFMMNVILLAGLPLAAATVAGVVVSAFQAVTQIQDQTLSQTVKIAVITFILISFGAGLISPLLNSTQLLFDSFGEYFVE